MKIIADRAIPSVNSIFKGMGDVVLRDGREISPSILQDADILLVRSVTRIDRQLLEDSHVACVATATSGYDHVDIAYLQEKNIGFVHAPGCNARSVAEYILSSLFILAGRNEFDLKDKSVGIIGCGNVGSAVYNLLGNTGMRCLVHDPPLADAGDSRYTFHHLDEVLAADIVTIHVPLVTDGPFATRYMVNKKFLAALRPDAILINTSRGEVVDEAALADYLEADLHAEIVMDVWQNEPSINTSLLPGLALATPHIAGYSADGKIRGTEMIYQGVCRYFGMSDDLPFIPELPPAKTSKVDVSGLHHDMEMIQKAVLASYDASTDDTSLRQILDIPETGRDAFFSGLRNNYPVRREFSAMTVSLSPEAGLLRDKFIQLGFKLEQ